MFVSDLLHEFELGVWKAFFTHMIRLLYAVGQNTIQELNLRCVCCNPSVESPLTYLQAGTVKFLRSGGILSGDSVIMYQQ